MFYLYFTVNYVSSSNDGIFIRCFNAGVRLDTAIPYGVTVHVLYKELIDLCEERTWDSICHLHCSDDFHKKPGL